MSSDLLYVPSSPTDINFSDYVVDGVTKMTAAEQQDAFWAYVQGNDYLKSREGKYAERFGQVQPWLHRFDAKILQDIFSTFGTNRKYTLQLSLDLLNIGNLLNDKWGTYTYNPLIMFVR